MAKMEKVYGHVRFFVMVPDYVKEDWEKNIKYLDKVFGDAELLIYDDSIGVCVDGLQRILVRDFHENGEVVSAEKLAYFDNLLHMLTIGVKLGRGEATDEDYI